MIRSAPGKSDKEFLEEILGWYQPVQMWYSSTDMKHLWIQNFVSPKVLLASWILSLEWIFPLQVNALPCPPLWGKPASVLFFYGCSLFTVTNHERIVYQRLGFVVVWNVKLEFYSRNQNFNFRAILNRTGAASQEASVEERLIHQFG